MRCVVCFTENGHGAATAEEAQTTARRMEEKNLLENIISDSGMRCTRQGGKANSERSSLKLL